MTIESLVSIEVFQGFSTGPPPGPARAGTEMAAFAATTFSFIVLILKTLLNTDKGGSQFAIFAKYEPLMIARHRHLFSGSVKNLPIFVFLARGSGKYHYP